MTGATAVLAASLSLLGLRAIESDALASQNIDREHVPGGSTQVEEEGSKGGAGEASHKGASAVAFAEGAGEASGIVGGEGAIADKNVGAETGEAGPSPAGTIRAKDLNLVLIPGVSTDASTCTSSTVSPHHVPSRTNAPTS